MRKKAGDFTSWPPNTLPRGLWNFPEFSTCFMKNSIPQKNHSILLPTTTLITEDLALLEANLNQIKILLPWTECWA